MEKEKQIEEMARAICGNSYNPKTGICDKSDIKCDFSCVAYLKSKRMYALGYGNVKEALKDFAERVKGIFSGNAEERQKGYAKEIGCFLTVGEFNEEIDELIKEVCSETADALIAAGIGDVKAAEHRAEVAERALKECKKAECKRFKDEKKKLKGRKSV